MMSRTWPSGLGPGRPVSVRQLAAATRMAAICSSVRACGWLFGAPQRRGALDRVAGDRVVAQRKPEQQVQHRPRSLCPRGRVCRLRLEEPLHAAGGDLAEGEVLERREHVQPHLVSVALLGPGGELPQVQIHQPQRDEVAEGAGQAELAAAAVADAIQKPLLQQCLRSRGRARGGGHFAEPAVEIPEPGLGNAAIDSGHHIDGAVGADRGTRAPAAHRRAPCGCRAASASSIRAGHVSISLARKRSSRPTRNPRGPRPWLRRS